MPIIPYNSRRAIITKSPRYGNKNLFSTGASSAEITVWEVWNSRYKRQVSPHSKIINDETTCIVRTHCAIAAELQSDDGLKLDGYTYSVQSVHPVKTALDFRSQDYEITLK